MPLNASSVEPIVHDFLLSGRPRRISRQVGPMSMLAACTRFRCSCGGLFDGAIAVSVCDP